MITKKVIAKKCLVLLSVFSSAAVLATQAESQTESVETDSEGRVVVSNGELRNYSQAESAQQTASALASFAPQNSVPTKAVSNASVNTSSANDEYFHVKSYGGFGSGIGKSGLESFIDPHTGKLKLVMGGSTSTFGSNDYFSVISYQDNSYEQEIISPFFSEGITELATIDLAGNPLVGLGLGNGTFELRRPADASLIRSINVFNSAINDVLVVDLDGDNTVEIALLSNSALAIVDSQNWAVTTYDGFGGSSFAAGNVDSDGATELVISSGKVVELQADGEIVTEWDNGDQFGALIALVNMDSDPRLEIVGAYSWYTLQAYDAEIRSLTWSIQADLDIDALAIADTDGDGVEEILYGDGQWGSVYILEASTGNTLRSVGNPRHGVTDILVADVDGDDHLELLWGAGASSTGEDHLYVNDMASLENEWKNPHAEGPYYSKFFDVEGDGDLEVIVASQSRNETFNDASVVRIYDYLSGALQAELDTSFLSRAWNGMRDFTLKNVDNDPQAEIFYISSDIRDGRIYVQDSVTEELQQTFSFDDDIPLYAIAVDDLNGDQTVEIAVLATGTRNGVNGTYLYVVDATTGEELWVSESLGGFGAHNSSIEIGNIDGDAQQEIVLSYGDIYIVDGETFELEVVDVDNVIAIEAVGVNELYGATYDGELYLYSAGVIDGNSILFDFGSICESEINALAQIDEGTLAYTCANEIRALDLESFESRPLVADHGSVNAGVRDNLEAIIYGGESLLTFAGKHKASVYANGEITEVDLSVSLSNATSNGYDAPFAWWLSRSKGALLFNAQIENKGPEVAENVTLTLNQPAGTSLSGVEILDGAVDLLHCTTADDFITCNLGRFIPNATVSLKFNFEKTEKGERDINAVVASDGREANPDDNVTSKTFGGSIGFYLLAGLALLLVSRRASSRQ